MKNNTFKRVLAGSLALLTVAAPMSANVEGVLQEVAIVASAADEKGDTKVSWEERVQDYITSISDGVHEVSAGTISTSTNFYLDAKKVATIVSSVPLTFTGATELAKADATEADLTEKNTSGDYINLGKYIANEKDGVYTYKVLLNTALTIDGSDATYLNFSTAGGETLTLADTTKVKTVTPTETVKILKGKKDDSTDVAVEDFKKYDTSLIEKGNATLYSEKAFEVYVKSNTVAPIVNVKASYNVKNKRYEATFQVPASDAFSLTDGCIYVSKIEPNYTYTNNGTTVLASDDTGATVNAVAASVSATYQAKVKQTKDEGTGYKYDTVTKLANKGAVPNASRVELKFTNDPFLTAKDASAQYYTLKITKDGEELKDDAKIQVKTAYDNTVGVTQVDDSSKTYKAIKGGVSDPSDTPENKTYLVPNGATAAATESTISFNATGKYVVEYTVFTTTTTGSATTTQAQKMTYEFEIQTKDALTADCVTLKTGAANKVKTPGEEKSAIVNGVVEIEVSDDWKNDVVNITPTIYVDADHSAPLQSADDKGQTTTLAPGTPKSVTGNVTPSVLNTVYELTLVYNNSDYSDSDQTIKVQYKLVPPKQVAKVTPDLGYLAKKLAESKTDEEDNVPGYGTATYNNGYTFTNRPDGTYAYFKTTIDKIDTIEEDFRKTIAIENAEESDVTFVYADNFGGQVKTEELDYYEDGFPTEVGKYTVYAMADDEIIAAFNVQVADHGLYAALTDEQLTYTYGVKELNSKDIAFVDADGNAVADAGVENAKITYYEALKLTAAQAKKVTDDNTITFAKGTKVDGVVVAVDDSTTYTVYEKDGSYYIAGDEAGENEVAGYTDAGNYIVTVDAQESTKVTKEGFDLMETSFVMNVAQKEITEKMVLINPCNYKQGQSKQPTITQNTNAANGPTGTATEGLITVKDVAVMDGDNAKTIDVIVAGGTSSAKEIGEYDVDLQVDEAASKNYTGKITAKWHIVANGTTIANSLKFVDASTTIYTNGQIHFEVTRADDTQFSNGVSKFGVIIEKDGLLDAPKKNTANVESGSSFDQKLGNYPRKDYTGNAGFAAADQFKAATAALQVGNGFKEGNQGAKQKKETPTKYGANINVTAVDTGAWFRPYVIDGKGNVYYGDVIYVNLVQEATDKLNLKMAVKAGNGDEAIGIKTKDEAKKDQSATVLANKSWRNDVKSGYSEKNAAYYVYGAYTLDKDTNVKSDAVQGFGVVVDKKGVFTPDGKLAEDDTVKVADALKLGKGFIEGKSGSNKMDIDEYGAMISPYNTVTGVWVRAYVDFGNDLVVYTEPVYIDPVSTIYNGKDTVKIEDSAFSYNRTDKQWSLNFAPNVAKLATSTYTPTFKNAGVIVDKSGSFLTKRTDEGHYGEYNDYIADTADAKNLTNAKNKMVLGNGYIQGKRPNNPYNAKVTPDTYRPTASAAEMNIPVVIRPYATYTINDKDVVIYGAPVVTTKNG